MVCACYRSTTKFNDWLIRLPVIIEIALFVIYPIIELLIELESHLVNISRLARNEYEKYKVLIYQ